MSVSLRKQVWERAQGHCEYCRLPSEHDPRPFHLDHVRPRKHAGPTELGNLALSCSACSYHKGPNAAGYDPETNSLQALFNPRTDVWSEHFVWEGGLLIGRSAVGRTTITVLCINDELRVRHRELLIELGVFPPC